MTPEQFCYWLQGFVELNGGPPTEYQWKSIVDHIKLVFDKRTPEFKPAYVPPERIKATPSPMPPQYHPAIPYPPYIGDPITTFMPKIVC